MKILINNRQKIIPISPKNIQRLATKLLKTLKSPKNSVLSLLLCNDKIIRSINKEQRNIDEPTDVLSFPMPRIEVSGGSSQILLGDIAISIETAIRQATELKHSLESEIAFLIIHGILHLNGYDHVNDDDRRVMASKENELYKVLLKAGQVHENLSDKSAVINRAEIS